MSSFDEQAVRPAGVSRRTLVKTAAWSVPAVTLAVGAPAASASNGSVTFDFVASLLLLRHSDTLSVLVAITNNGSEQVTDTATVTLTGIPGDEVQVGFDPQASTYEPPVGSNDDAVPVENGAFVLSAPNDPNGSYILASGALTVSAGATVYLFFTLTWAATNHVQAFFVIVGSLTFGSATPPTDDVTVTYVDDPPAG